jgi:CheY-like chemotaxis protein
VTSTRGGILVVNDDPTQLRLACALLERQGYRAYPASGAAEGLRLLEQHPSIVGVVTDLHMPEVDGWRLCRLLRSPAYRDFNRLPILVTSATFSGEDAERITRELGANAFLPAPYQPAALARLVADMLEGRNAPAAPAVLLAQPDAAGARALEECFRSHGYSVQVATRAPEAAEILRNSVPEVVVMDLSQAAELLALV